MLRQLLESVVGSLYRLQARPPGRLPCLVLGDGGVELGFLDLLGGYGRAGMGISGSPPCGYSAVIQSASSHVQQQDRS